MNDNIEKGRPSQYFEDFLREQGNYEKTTEQAVNRVLAWQLAEPMKRQSISKIEMARRLSTP